MNVSRRDKERERERERRGKRESEIVRESEKGRERDGFLRPKKVEGGLYLGADINPQRCRDRPEIAHDAVF